MKRGMNMGKQRAIKLNLNRTFDEKNFGCDRNIVKDGKNECKFEPMCVFDENKPKWKFWRGARHIILFVDGAVKALRFGKTTVNMNPFWTQAEEEELIKREMKKSLAKHKPMSWAQFIILLVPMILIFIVVLKIAIQFGVF